MDNSFIPSECTRITLKEKNKIKNQDDEETSIVSNLENNQQEDIQIVVSKGNKQMYLNVFCFLIRFLSIIPRVHKFRFPEKMNLEKKK